MIGRIFINELINKDVTDIVNIIYENIILNEMIFLSRM